MVEIVNLENKKITTQKIADNDIVDVTHSINASIKEKTKDKFIKLFVDNFAYLVENCSSNARTIFWVIMKYLKTLNTISKVSQVVDKIFNPKFCFVGYILMVLLLSVTNFSKFFKM